MSKAATFQDFYLLSDLEKVSEHQDGGKKGSRLSNLIYGTPEAREMDKEIERSFSQVLARGKYVHSIVFHEVKPDKVDEYVELVGKWYPRMAGMPENKVHLVGSWRTEVGDSDTFGMYLLSYYASDFCLPIKQYTSGSISVIRDITSRFTTFNTTPTSPSLTTSSSLSSTLRRSLSCRSSRSGQPLHPVS